MATSVNASDHHSSVELVQKGALLNCVDKTWSSLLCILALSTVTLTIFFFFLILVKSVKLIPLLNQDLVHLHAGTYIYCSVSKE